MVPAVCSWHEHHQHASAEIERRLGAGERLIAPASALVEAYAVLTRLPAPHRLAPADAWTLIRANFVEHAQVVGLPNAAYARVLARLAEASISGGRSYDAIIGECARVGRADTLLTFNARHFDPPPADVSVVVPS